MRWVAIAALVAAGVMLAVFWGDVPDRWTINFAHRRAWPVMIALIAVPITLAVLIACLAR